MEPIEQKSESGVTEQMENLKVEDTKEEEKKEEYKVDEGQGDVEVGEGVQEFSRNQES